jgi:hypothetical protein
MVEMYTCLESNAQNNSDDMDQPGYREWREACFIYIVIEDVFSKVKTEK